MMFFINLPVFESGGRLVPLIPVLLASLIQYFNNMCADGFTITNYPNINQLVKGVMKVLNASESEASNKLKEWSTEVGLRCRRSRVWVP